MPQANTSQVAHERDWKGDRLVSLDARELRHSVTGAECFDVAARTGMARETLPY